MPIYHDKIFFLCKGYKTGIIKKPLVFFHIPKCGGTTVCNIMLQLFSNSIRAYGTLSSERGTTSAYENFMKDKNKIIDSQPTFICGHFQYSIIKFLKGYMTTTVLRNPYDRAISHYNMILGKNLIDKNTSLEQCFENNIIPRNPITQMFSCNNNHQLDLTENNYKIALDVLLNKIDIVIDITSIGKFLNYIISKYDFPNLFYQKMQISKSIFSEKTLKIKNICEQYNLYDLKIYNYFKKNNHFFYFDKNHKHRKEQNYFLNTIDYKTHKQILNSNEFYHVSKALQNNGFDILEQ